MRDNSHWFDRITLIPSFSEVTTGRDNLELAKRFLFLLRILRQKPLHFEGPREAVILAWADRDPATRREQPQMSPLWIFNAIRLPVLTATLRARRFFAVIGLDNFLREFDVGAQPRGFTEEVETGDVDSG